MDEMRRGRRLRGAISVLAATALMASCGTSNDLGSPDLGIQEIEEPDGCDGEEACAETFSVAGVGLQISCQALPDEWLDVDPPIAVGAIDAGTPSVVGRVEGIPVDVAVGVAMEAEGPCGADPTPLSTWASRPGDFVDARAAICSRYPELDDGC